MAESHEDFLERGIQELDINSGSEGLISPQDDYEGMPRAKETMETQPVQETSESPTEYYKRKTDGKGYCLIFVNFQHEDLKGYQADVRKIKTFFVPKGFEVKEYTDFTKPNFEEALQNEREHLKSSQANYDRLFVFILSHGKEQGILCRDKAIVPAQDVIDIFTHDKLPSLKDYPKCFFFQICSGGQPPVAASDVVYPTAPPEKELPRTRHIIVHADIMVAFPSLHTNPSYAYRDTGSWFIQQLLEAMQQHKDEHIVDILTHATRELSEMEATKIPHYCNKGSYQILMDHEGTKKPLKIFVEMETKRGKIFGEIDHRDKNVKRRRKIPKGHPISNVTITARGDFRKVITGLEIQTVQDLDVFSVNDCEIEGTLLLQKQIKGLEYETKEEGWATQLPNLISEELKPFIKAAFPVVAFVTIGNQIYNARIEPMDSEWYVKVECMANKEMAVPESLTLQTSGSIYKLHDDWYIDAGSVALSKILRDTKLKAYGVLGDDDANAIDIDNLLEEPAYLATIHGTVCDEDVLKCFSYEDKRYGMLATARQLPVIKSMLTKKLYLAEPPVPQITGNVTGGTADAKTKILRCVRALMGSASEIKKITDQMTDENSFKTQLQNCQKDIKIDADEIKAEAENIPAC